MLQGSGNHASTESKLDQMFEVLSHRHRRYALRVLQARDEPVPTAELAGDVLEMDGAVEQSPTSCERVRVALHHTHVPKLAEADLVATDGDVVGLSIDGEMVELGTALLECAE